MSMTSTLMAQAGESGMKLGSSIGRKVAEDAKRSAKAAVATSGIQSALPMMEKMRAKLTFAIQHPDFQQSVSPEVKQALRNELNELAKLGNMMRGGGKRITRSKKKTVKRRRHKRRSTRRRR